MNSAKITGKVAKEPVIKGNVIKELTVRGNVKHTYISSGGGGGESDTTLLKAITPFVLCYDTLPGTLIPATIKEVE